MMVGDTSLTFNSTIGGKIASLFIQQLPGVPVPFVFPGIKEQLHNYIYYIFLTPYVFFCRVLCHLSELLHSIKQIYLS